MVAQSTAMHSTVLPCLVPGSFRMSATPKETRYKCDNVDLQTRMPSWKLPDADTAAKDIAKAQHRVLGKKRVKKKCF